eukprot:CAMPEP_0201560410 /NCGR_PEP_ID=MMETSP0173_2-20130828/78254_1 /ASSEMBLY_ACC=CAM_ASM_000268 /TAXON_ID=218659 /ORGANISM="Vexillifera sp., Strain DIVA3 564/2" /LENGTH=930 /DNA_ID=CAMNT_0047974857 /DNA_START=193 /DNA_END=2983 /DNA_ORIENTATION=-
MKSETFTFVLTETNGDRRFGYCRRFLPKRSGKRYPECFCVTSFLPSFTIFSQVLDEVENRARTSFKAVTYFAEAILSEPFPKPGAEMIVSVCSWDKPGVVDNHSFFRPRDEYDATLEYINLEPLLRCLDARNILCLFGSLLIERRVVFVSSQLSRLSACCQSAAALLYPFTWQHIFIPVLPSSLLSFVCAPMPFVVGILASSLPEVEQLPMEETLMIDLDSNRFLRSPTSDAYHDFDLLDPIKLAPLFKAVTEAKKDCDKSSKFTFSKKQLQRVLNNFITFIISQIAYYKEFVPSATGLDEFDKAGFIEKRPAASRKLAEHLVGSQMFEQFAASNTVAPLIEEKIKLFHKEDQGSKQRQEQALTYVRAAKAVSTKAEAMYDAPLVNSDASATEPILHQGHLKKLSGKTRAKSWDRRWFVLTTAQLRYYRSKTNKTPKGTITLSDISSVAYTDRHRVLNIDPTLICIEITTPERSYLMHGDTLEDTERWLLTLQALMEALKEQEPNSSPFFRNSSAGSSNSFSSPTPTVNVSAITASLANKLESSPIRKIGGVKPRTATTACVRSNSPLVKQPPKRVASFDFSQLQKNLNRSKSMHHTPPSHKNTKAPFVHSTSLDRKPPLVQQPIPTLERNSQLVQKSAAPPKPKRPSVTSSSGSSSPPLTPVGKTARRPLGMRGIARGRGGLRGRSSSPNNRALPSPNVSNNRALPSPNVSNNRVLPSPNASNNRVLPSPNASNNRALPSPTTNSSPQRTNTSNNRVLPSPNASNNRALPSPTTNSSPQRTNTSNNRALPSPTTTSPNNRALPSPTTTSSLQRTNTSNNRALPSPRGSSTLSRGGRGKPNQPPVHTIVIRTRNPNASQNRNNKPVVSTPSNLANPDSITKKKQSLFGQMKRRASSEFTSSKKVNKPSSGGSTQQQKLAQAAAKAMAKGN